VLFAGKQNASLVAKLPDVPWSELDACLLAGATFLRTYKCAYPPRGVLTLAPARFALAALAAATDADLVVVGSKGLTGVKRAVLRSTSTHLIENASCPCLVYREPSEPFEIDG
jgi:hypothetical protein